MLLIWKKKKKKKKSIYQPFHPLGTKVTKYRLNKAFSTGSVSSFLFCNIYTKKNMFEKIRALFAGEKSIFSMVKATNRKCAALGFDFLPCLSVDLLARPCLASRHWG